MSLVPYPTYRLKFYLRRRCFVILVYITNPTITMASIPILLAVSGVIPSRLQTLETKLLVRNATAISINGRQMLYPLILPHSRLIFPSSVHYIIYLFQNPIQLFSMFLTANSSVKVKAEDMQYNG